MYSILITVFNGLCKAVDLRNSNCIDNLSFFSGKSHIVHWRLLFDKFFWRFAHKPDMTAYVYSAKNIQFIAFHFRNATFFSFSNTTLTKKPLKEPLVAKNPWIFFSFSLHSQKTPRFLYEFFVEVYSRKISAHHQCFPTLEPRLFEAVEAGIGEIWLPENVHFLRPWRGRIAVKMQRYKSERALVKSSFTSLRLLWP